MSLSEETLSIKPSLQMPFTSCQSAIKSLEQIRQELAEQTAAYFAKGGKINYGTPTHNTLEMPAYESDLQRTIKAKKRERAHKAVASRVLVQSPISYMDGSNRTIQRARSGYQNITTKESKNGLRHTVVIGCTNYGTYDDIKDAIAKRDAQREILGMEKAFY